MTTLRGPPYGSPVGSGLSSSRLLFALMACGFTVFNSVRARGSGSRRSLFVCRRSIAFGFCALSLRDARIAARLTPDRLRRLAVCAEKGTSQPVAIPLDI